VADAAAAHDPPKVRRARRKRFLLLAALLVAAAGIALGALLARGDGVRRGGPLACSGCYPILEGLPLDLGRAGTEGTAVILNRGDQDAILDAVTYERLTAGLRMLAPLALRVGDYGGPGLVVGLARSFPPKRARGIARPLRGFVVHPYRTRDEAVELLNGFQPLRRGVLGYQELSIHYHVGGRQYVARYPMALVICSPEASYPKSCPSEH
jgi:hypothetical protein